MELDQVMEAIERDRRYYETSGGGMTVSGGEPLVQAEFTCALLERCRQVGIRTCLESTLHARWDVVERALAHADLLIADFKCADSAKHARVTGVPNDTILENLVRAADRTDQIIVRIPVIPGFNDGDADCAAAADFLERNLLGRIREVQLLEFMRMGEEKCHSLERPYPMEDCSFDREELHARILAFQSLL
jgi:pyruvate formate lyase activating enzyme